MTLRRSLLALAILSTALSGCLGGDDPAPGTGKTSYTVVTDAAFPPFEEIDENGGFVGYDIDVMREVARRNGWNVTFQNMGFEPLLLAVQNGQADMAISAITIKPDRSAVMDFSVSYYEANQSVSQRASDTRTFSSVADLRGKGLTFGVQGGTTAVDFVESEFTSKGDGTLKRYDTYPLALQALKTEEVDVVVMDEPAQRQAAESDPAVKVSFQFSTGESYGIAMPKGRAEQLGKVNDALEAMADDGTLAQLKEKWGI